MQELSDLMSDSCDSVWRGCTAWRGHGRVMDDPLGGCRHWRRRADSRSRHYPTTTGTGLRPIWVARYTVEDRRVRAPRPASGEDL